MFNLILVFFLAEMQIYRVFSMDQIRESYCGNMNSYEEGDKNKIVVYLDDDLRQDRATAKILQQLSERPMVNDNIFSSGHLARPNWPKVTKVSEDNDNWDCFIVGVANSGKKYGTSFVEVIVPNESDKEDSRFIKPSTSSRESNEEKPRSKKPSTSSIESDEEKPSSKKPSSESDEELELPKTCPVPRPFCNLPKKKAKKSCPKNCQDVQKHQGSPPNGIYEVWPSYLNYSIRVFCDMNTTGGGWTVIQRRTESPDSEENFYRPWKHYKNGFGDLKREFWLGNDAIFALSNEVPMILRIDLEDFEGAKKYAVYNIFRVSTEANCYKLKTQGYEGDAGDSFSVHNNKIFHTYDRTNTNCPGKSKGGWWYYACHESNLNGLYLRGKHLTLADGVNWKTFKGYHYSLKNVEMKVKPKLVK